MEDALRIGALLFILLAIPYAFYRLCLKLATWAASTSLSGPRLRRLGIALIVVGIVEQMIAVALFTWRGPPPPWWLAVPGAIGFWGWWAFVLAGVACLWVSSRKQPPIDSRRNSDG